MIAWLESLVAVLIAVHGVAYIPFGIVVPRALEKTYGRGGRQATGTMARPRLQRLVVILHVSAGVVWLACAVAIVLASWMPGMWRPLAIFGAVLGLAGFVTFWDGDSEHFSEEGGIGAAISASLLAGALAFPHAFG